MVQISSGWAKGMNLRVPPGEATRPTSAKVRAAVLNAIGADLTGASVLDLFAGSGALGIEALSRGASKAVLVDHAPAAIAALKLNVQELQRRATVQQLALPEIQVFHLEALSALKRLSAGAKTQSVFDLIFVDPPYAAALSLAPQLLTMLAPLTKEEGLIVFESSSDHADDIAALQPSAWEVVKQKSYGDTMVTHLYRTKTP